MAGDARTAGGGFALRTICVLGAVAMAAAGAYLFEPRVVDLGVYVERGKYALAGYALMYAALLVAFASTAGTIRTGNALADFALSLVVGGVALFALCALFALLAGEALLYRDPPNYWAGLFAVAAAVCFVASMFSEAAEQRALVASVAANGQADRGPFVAFLLVFAIVAIGIAAIMLYINVGYFLFYLLRMNVLEGADIDLQRVVSALLGVLRDVAVERWFYVVFMSVFAASLIYIIGLVGTAVERLSQRPASVPVKTDDEAYIEQCAQELEAYADAHGYTRDARRLLWLVALPLLLGPMFVAVIVGINLHNWFPRPYDPAALEALGWHVYERSTGASIVALVFAALLWGAAPNAILSRLSRSYSEIAGWSGFASGQLSPIYHLTRAFQAGIISRARKFDPGMFLHRVNTMYELYFLFPAVALSLAAAIVWHHDQSRYHVLTDGYVEVMGYWTLKRNRYAYSGVRGVALSCSLDDDGRAEASYAMTLPDGFAVEPFGNRAEVHVADLARIDGKIAIDKPRTFAVRKPLFREAVSDYDPLCVEALAAGLPESDAAQFRAIFRVEAWHKARWLERTTAPK